MIFTRHSVLKRGCSTWDKQLMPIEEFEVRLNSARSEMAKQNLDALVIYGDNYSFADLCYLTNYFPKVRGGIAVVPRQGGLSLLLNIGSRDVPFAKTLTWVDDVRASNLLGRDGAELLKEKNLTAAKIGFLDSGRGFPLPELEALKTALPGVQWQFSDSLVQQLRFRKNPRELAAIRHAGVLLEEICEAAPKFGEERSTRSLPTSIDTPVIEG
jgi:Xaa-Pro aminopeptidase